LVARRCGGPSRDPWPPGCRRGSPGCRYPPGRGQPPVFSTCGAARRSPSGSRLGAASLGWVWVGAGSAWGASACAPAPFSWLGAAASAGAAATPAASTGAGFAAAVVLSREPVTLSWAFRRLLGGAHGLLGIAAERFDVTLEIGQFGFAHGLVELGTKFRRLPFDHAHVLADRAQQRRQVLGTDHEQGHDPKDQQLAGSDVEHRFNLTAWLR